MGVGCILFYVQYITECKEFCLYYEVLDRKWYKFWPPGTPSKPTSCRSVIWQSCCRFSTFAMTWFTLRSVIPGKRSKTSLVLFSTSTQNNLKTHLWRKCQSIWDPFAAIRFSRQLGFSTSYLFLRLRHNTNKCCFLFKLTLSSSKSSAVAWGERVHKTLRWGKCKQSNASLLPMQAALISVPRSWPAWRVWKGLAG